MKRIGETKVEISELIQGTWVMGKDYWGGAEDTESIDAILCALDQGITTFDTAYIYGAGYAEELLGKALLGKRSKCQVITKLWKTDMAKARVQLGLEQAMQRLKTDYIDIFFIHYPSDEIPIEETMTELMRLKEEGKIGAIGVSNFSLGQMVEAQQYGKIDIIQPCYSLLWRFIDKDILPYCIENHISVIPYSPLGQGILTGKMKGAYKFKAEDKRTSTPLFLPENFNNALAVTEDVIRIGIKYNKTPAQTAIRWVMQAKGMSLPIVGARNKEQVIDNIGAIGWSLTEEDFKELDDISKRFSNKLPTYRTLFDKTIIESR